MNSLRNKQLPSVNPLRNRYPSKPVSLSAHTESQNAISMPALLIMLLLHKLKMLLKEVTRVTSVTTSSKHYNCNQISVQEYKTEGNNLVELPNSRFLV